MWLYAEMLGDQRPKGGSIKLLELKQLSTVHSLVHWMVIISGVAAPSRCAAYVDGLAVVATWLLSALSRTDTPLLVRVNAPDDRQEPPLKFWQTPWNGSRRLDILTVYRGGIRTVTFTLAYCYVYSWINTAYLTTLAVAETVWQNYIQRNNHLTSLKVCDQKFPIMQYFDLPGSSI